MLNRGMIVVGAEKGNPGKTGKTRQNDSESCRGTVEEASRNPPFAVCSFAGTDAGEKGWTVRSMVPQFEGGGARLWYQVGGKRQCSGIIVRDNGDGVMSDEQVICTEYGVLFLVLE